MDGVGGLIDVKCNEDDAELSNTKKIIATMMPSCDVRLKQPTIRKPSGQNTVVGNTATLEMDVGDTGMVGLTTNECIFKCGGMCTVHGCKGVKFTGTEKKWCAKGDGTYGYRSSKKTKYRCQLRGVAKANGSNPEYGGEKQTMSSQSVGNEKVLLGTHSGISRLR